MFDRMQYYFLKLYKFTKKKIHLIRYCNDIPKNKHFVKANKIYYLNEYRGNLHDTTLFERKSYKLLRIKQNKWFYIRICDVWKILDENDDIVWKKSVKL